MATVVSVVGVLEDAPNSSDVTANYPVGTRAGDLAVLAIAGVSNPSRYVPAGWSTIYAPTYGAAIAYQKVTSTGTIQLGSKVHAGIAVFRNAKEPGRIVTTTGMASLPVVVGGGWVEWEGATGGDGLTQGALPNGGYHGLAVPNSALIGYSSGGSGSASTAVEILPLTAPNAPTLTAPATGTQVGTGVNLPLQWRYNPSEPGRAQSSVQVQASVNGAAWQWVTAAGQLTATETSLDGSLTNVVLPAVLLKSGDAWQWRARSVESEEWSEWSTVSTFTPVTPPTVDVTGPSATVTDDLTPTVEWATTPGQGSQDAYRVQVSGTGVSYDTGILTGAAQSWTPGSALPFTRDASYTFTVTVRQTGGAWSAPDSITQTVTWTPPTIPTLTASPASPGVLLHVDVPAGQLVDIQHIVDGEWQDLLTQQVATVQGSLDFRDVLAHFGTNTYRARTFKDIDGMLLPSNWTVEVSVEATDTGAYLARVADPTDYVAINVLGEGARSRKREGAVHEPVNSDADFVEYGITRRQTGTLTLQTWRAADADVLDRLLLSGEALWYRPGPDFTVDLGDLEYDPQAPVKLLIKPDDHVVERVVTKRAQPWRKRTVAWVEAV